MQRVIVFALFLFGSFVVGCGPAETVIPKDGLTPEQQAAVKAEDAAIEMEESQGKAVKKKK